MQYTRTAHDVVTCGMTTPRTIYGPALLDLTEQEADRLISLLSIEYLRRYLAKGRARSALKEPSWLDDWLDDDSLAGLPL